MLGLAYFKKRVARYNIPEAIFHAFCEGGKQARARQEEERREEAAAAEAARLEAERSAAEKRAIARKKKAERLARLTQSTASSASHGAICFTVVVDG